MVQLNGSKPHIQSGIFPGVNVFNKNGWVDSLNYGLKAYYPIRQIQNTTLTDVVAGKNGTLGTSVLWGKKELPKINSYLVGNDTNEVTFGNFSDYFGLGTTSIFTLVAWVFTPAISGNIYVFDMGFRSSTTASANDGLQFSVVNSVVNFRIRQGITTGYNTEIRGNWLTDLSIIPNMWNMIVCQRDLSNGYCHIYNASKYSFNNISQGGATYTLTEWQSLGYRIHARYNNNSAGVFSSSGTCVANIGIWDRLLYDFELRRLYNNGNGLYRI